MRKKNWRVLIQVNEVIGVLDSKALNASPEYQGIKT
jgi:hypothetical protein